MKITRDYYMKADANRCLRWMRKCGFEGRHERTEDGHRVMATPKGLQGVEFIALETKEEAAGRGTGHNRKP